MERSIYTYCDLVKMDARSPVPGGEIGAATGRMRAMEMAGRVLRDPKRKTAALSAAVLPLLGSNQDSPDPEGPL
jgi:hypothetical protein